MNDIDKIIQKKIYVDVSKVRSTEFKKIISESSSTTKFLYLATAISFHFFHGSSSSTELPEMATITRKPETVKCEEDSCTRLGACWTAAKACLLGGGVFVEFDDCWESVSLLLLLLLEDEDEGDVDGWLF